MPSVHDTPSGIGHKSKNCARAVGRESNQKPPDAAGPSSINRVADADTVAGTGFQRGHRTQTCPSGDKWFSTYHGTVTTTSKPSGPPDVTGEGTWQLTGGTGRYQDARGGGTYKGRLTPQGFVYEWQGDFVLK
jgi:hypothetical protein